MMTGAHVHTTEGVATSAIAKIVTGEEYLDEFLKLDAEYKNLDHDIEALIGVDYSTDRGIDVKDTRRIQRVWFEELVDITAENAEADQ